MNMKFLIILLLALSCSIEDDSVVEEEEFVETKPEHSIVEILEHMEGVHFKTVQAYHDETETVVHLVVMRRANSLGIVKVWYTHNVFKNGDLLAEDKMSSVVVTVQTLKKGSYSFKRQYINVAAASDEVVDKVSEELKNIAQQKFFEIVKLLVENEVI